MTLLNLFFLLPNVLLQKNTISGEKKRTKREIFASIVIYRVTPRVFFFQIKTETGICFLFFFKFSLAFIYFV